MARFTIAVPILVGSIVSLASQALAADGAQLFNMQCKLCHQPAGSAPTRARRRQPAGGRGQTLPPRRPGRKGRLCPR